jgi:hypothetical protein
VENELLALLVRMLFWNLKRVRGDLLRKLFWKLSRVRVEEFIPPNKS